MSEATSFYRGAALSDAAFGVLGSYDRRETFYPDTQIVVFDRSGGWEQIKRWDVFGAGIARFSSSAGTPEAVVLAETGEILLTRSPDTIEQVSEETLPAMTGPVVVDGRVIAVSAAGAHFMRDAEGAWAPLVPGAFDVDFLSLDPVEQAMKVMGYSSLEEYDKMSLEEEARSFELVLERTKLFHGAGGPAWNDLYLVGAQGAVLHFDGTSYTPLDLDEQSNLTRVRVHDGQIYLAGGHRGSVIWRGSAQDGFEKIFDWSNRTIYLDTLVHFGGSIFIGDPQEATGGLYELRGSELFKSEAIDGPVRKVDAFGDVLWVMQEKALHRFDGKSWERFDSPYL